MAEKIKVMETRMEEEDIQFLKALDYQREGQKVLLKELIRFDAEQEPCDKELIAYYNELYIDTLAQVSLLMSALKDKYIPTLPEGNLVEVAYGTGTIYGTNSLMSEETKPSCACGIDQAETCNCCGGAEIPIELDANYHPEEFKAEESYEFDLENLHTIENEDGTTDMIIQTNEGKVFEMANVVPVSIGGLSHTEETVEEEIERNVSLEEIRAMNQEEREFQFKALMAMYKAGCGGDCEHCEEDCAEEEK